jgi:2-polyprenyl-6-hydroxyphenyl methylase/3-demethylubiquinone-9 3-methyltransferase
MSETSTMTGITIDPREAAHFDALAAAWWDPRGSSAMLHRLNPPRLAYLREQVDAHWGGDAASFTPLAGRTAIDVGCGAGLACEPLARLGARVTGVDAASEAIAVARDHAAGAGLAIDYRTGSVEDLSDRFDLVTSFEVIEHASDQPSFVRGLARALAPGGLLVMSTPNRTAFSRAAMIGVAEGTGMIPRGTHDWHRFLTPEELTQMLGDAGLRVIDVRGLTLGARGFALGGSTALNYLLTAVRA